MKIQIASIVLVAAAALAPSVAHADPDRAGSAGVDFELLPSGTFETSGGLGGSAKSDADVAYAIGVIAEKPINELVSIGLAPRYVFHVIGKNDSGDSATQLDLRARVAVGHDFSSKLRLYGFAEPGWSILFLPSTIEINGNKVHPNGFVLGLGGGLSYALSRSVRGYFELGYQLGYQTWSWSGTVLGQTVTDNGDASDSYLQLGFGVATAFD